MGRRRRQTIKKENAIRKIIWKVILYIRLSREDGNDESYSVVNQRGLLTAFIEQRPDEFQLIDICIDDGCTGTDTQREGFQKMVHMIEEGKANCVIVKDLSRLSRNYSDAGYYLETFFIRYGVRFIALEFPAVDTYLRSEDLDSPMIPMTNVFNDTFCRQTSVKIRNVFNFKKSQGLFIGAFAPYGYQKDKENKNHLMIDEEAAGTVRDIFQWYLSGVSKNGIARKLDSLGIPSPTEYKQNKGENYTNPQDKYEKLRWSARTVDSILKNQMYIGNMVQGRQKVKSYKVHERVSIPEEEWCIVEGTHEAVIEKPLFQEVQELLKKNTRSATGGRNVYPLSGFLRCSDCGKAIVRHSSKGIVYYKCSTYKSHSTACSSHSIREDKLTQAVLTAINMQIDVLVDLSALIEEINAAPHVKRESIRVQQGISSQQKKLEQQKRYQKKLYESLIDGRISQSQYDEYNQEYENEIAAAETVMRELETEAHLMQQGITNEEPFFQQFLQYGHITELTREILSALVDYIVVDNDKNIDIHFKFRDEYIRAAEFAEMNKGQTETSSGADTSTKASA